MLHFGSIETKFERPNSMGSCTIFLYKIICLMKHETQVPNVKHKHTHTHTMLQLRKCVNQTFTLCLGLIVMFNGLLTPYSNKLVELKTIANQQIWHQHIPTNE
jgi:hypothetical protein